MSNRIDSIVNSIKTMIDKLDKATIWHSVEAALQQDAAEVAKGYHEAHLFEIARANAIKQKLSDLISV